MIEAQHTYVLIKIAGRSWSAVYHELAIDGSTPLCGTSIKPDDWALRTRQVAWRRRQCQQCAKLLQAASCKHEQLVDGYYGHDCAACGVLVYPYGCEPWAPDDDSYDDDSDYPAAGCDDWDDDEDYWLYNCGWVRGEGCTKAGSEECDFECPMRRDFEKGMRLTQTRLAKRATP